MHSRRAVPVGRRFAKGLRRSDPGSAAESNRTRSLSRSADSVFDREQPQPAIQSQLSLYGREHRSDAALCGLVLARDRAGVGEALPGELAHLAARYHELLHLPLSFRLHHGCAGPAGLGSTGCTGIRSRTVGARDRDAFILSGGGPGKTLGGGAHKLVPVVAREHNVARGWPSSTPGFATNLSRPRD